MTAKLEKYAERFLGIAERATQALEKLAEEPFVELEPPPPVCPHCNALDPDVVVEETEGRGHISEFVLTAYCSNCKKKIYGVTREWVLLPEGKMAISAMEKIKEGSQ